MPSIAGVLTLKVNVWLMAECMDRYHRDQPEASKQGASARIISAPSIVVNLVLVIIAAHILYLLLPMGLKIFVNFVAAVSPARLLQLENGPVIAATQLIGHMFLHAGWAHLLLNCVWLLAFGAPVARMLRAQRPAGAAIFIVFFLTSGVMGALVYALSHANDHTMLIGASGGVSGLLGGLVRFAFRSPPQYRAEPAPEGVRLVPRLSGLFDTSVLVWTGAVIMLNAVAGLYGAGVSDSATGIAWESHIGGYLFGLVSFPLFARLAWGR